MDALSAVVPTKGFTETEKLRRALAQEKAIDFQRVEAERTELIHTLSARLTREALRGLLERSLAYRANRIGYGEYYAYLRRLTESSGLKIQSFGGFDRYIRYVLTAEGIDKPKLFDELDALKESVIARAEGTREQKEVVRLGEDLRLARRLVNNELTPAEWARYRGRRDDFHRLMERAHAAAPRASKETDTLAHRLPLFERFYTAADARNHAMLFNLQAKAAAEGTNVMALVTGGFHTAGLAELLEQQKISYAVVTPKIGKVDGDAKYLDVFTMSRLPLEKMLLGEKLFLGLPLNTAANVLRGAGDSRAAGALRNFPRAAAEALSASARRGRAVRFHVSGLTAFIADARQRGAASIRAVPANVTERAKAAFASITKLFTASPESEPARLPGLAALFGEYGKTRDYAEQMAPWVEELGLLGLITALPLAIYRHQLSRPQAKSILSGWRQIADETIGIGYRGWSILFLIVSAALLPFHPGLSALMYFFAFGSFLPAARLFQIRHFIASFWAGSSAEVRRGTENSVLMVQAGAAVAFLLGATILSPKSAEMLASLPDSLASILSFRAFWIPVIVLAPVFVHWLVNRLNPKYPAAIGAFPSEKQGVHPKDAEWEMPSVPELKGPMHLGELSDNDIVLLRKRVAEFGKRHGDRAWVNFRRDEKVQGVRVTRVDGAFNGENGIFELDVAIGPGRTGRHVRKEIEHFPAQRPEEEGPLQEIADFFRKDLEDSASPEIVQRQALTAADMDENIARILVESGQIPTKAVPSKILESSDDVPAANHPARWLVLQEGREERALYLILGEENDTRRGFQRVLRYQIKDGALHGRLPMLPESPSDGIDDSTLVAALYAARKALNLKEGILDEDPPALSAILEAESRADGGVDHLSPAARDAMIAYGQILADYLADRSIGFPEGPRYSLEDPLLATPDVIVVFGMGNALVAERAADLFLRALKENENVRIVFTGGNGRATPQEWADRGMSEAQALGDIFLSRIRELRGSALAEKVEKNLLMLENHAFHSGHNVEYTIDLLRENGIDPDTVLLLHAPLMAKRSALATWLKRSTLDDTLISCYAAFRIDFNKLTDKQLIAACRFMTEDRVLPDGERLMGESQRLREYPGEGFTAEMPMPPEARTAERRLKLIVDGLVDRRGAESLPHPADVIVRDVRFGLHELMDEPWIAPEAGQYGERRQRLRLPLPDDEDDYAAFLDEIAPAVGRLDEAYSIGVRASSSSGSKETVSFWETFDVPLDEEQQRVLEEAVRNSDGRLALVTREHILAGKMEDAVIGGERRAVGLTESAPSLLEDFSSMSPQERQAIAERYSAAGLAQEGFRLDGRMDDDLLKAPLRVSASIAARIKAGDRYLLIRTPRDAEDGTPRYIPVGGGTSYLGREVRRFLEETLGATAFEGDKRSEPDLRMRLPAESLPAFEAWYAERRGRELNALREMREELVFEEFRALTQRQFEELFILPALERPLKKDEPRSPNGPVNTFALSAASIFALADFQGPLQTAIGVAALLLIFLAPELIPFARRLLPERAAERREAAIQGLRVELDRLRREETALLAKLGAPVPANPLNFVARHLTERDERLGADDAAGLSELWAVDAAIVSIKTALMELTTNVPADWVRNELEQRSLLSLLRPLAGLPDQELKDAAVLFADATGFNPEKDAASLTAFTHETKGKDVFFVVRDEDSANLTAPLLRLGVPAGRIRSLSWFLENGFVQGERIDFAAALAALADGEKNLSLSSGAVPCLLGSRTPQAPFRLPDAGAISVEQGLVAADGTVRIVSPRVFRLLLEAALSHWAQVQRIIQSMA